MILKGKTGWFQQGTLNGGSRKSTLRDYGISFVSIAVMAIVCFPFSHLIGYQAVGLILLMVVATLALLVGRGAVLFAAFLNFVTWNFFFIPPLFTFRVHSVHDVITLFANLMVAIVGSTLISRIRQSEQDLKKSKDRIALLNTFLQDLNDAKSIKEVVKVVQVTMKEQFNAETIIYLKMKEGFGLAVNAFGNTALSSETGYRAASYAFENRVSTGVSTNFFSETGVHYFPLIEPRRVIGVLGLSIPGEKEPDEDKLLLLRSFNTQITSALEREISIDLAKDKEIYSESEKLFQALMNSVSHELRTPMAIIAAAVSNLNDDKTSRNPEIRKQICEELDFAARRMNYLVENILDMSRIESGHLRLNLQYCDMEDLVGMVIHSMKNELERNDIHIIPQENLPLIRGDINLLRQALVNILHNAVTYSPSDTTITIEMKKSDSEYLAIEVTDNGMGVPENSLPRLFDKFYRVPGSKSGGTGLGLAITKAIIDLHQGKIIAENFKGAGLKISMLLIPDTEDGKAKE